MLRAFLISIVLLLGLQRAIAEEPAEESAAEAEASEATKAAEEQGLVLRFVNDPAGTGQRLLDMQENGWSMVNAPEGAESSPGEVSAGEVGPDSTHV